MGNYASKVIEIAAGEVGYLEKSAIAYKKNPAILDQKTAGAGSDNYTKYGRDMHKVYPAVMDFPAYWCDAFTDWCFYKAYGVTTAKSLLAGNFDDYTVASASMYQKKNALDTTPKKGAQVFFTRNGATSGCYHTGIVYKVDGTYFYTIEGNTSGASAVVSNGGGVAKKKYSISAYKGKVIFGHPKYDDEPAATPGKKKSISEAAKDVLAGKYGNGNERKAGLKKDGYTDAEIEQIQSKVNETLNTPATKKKSITETAKSVIAGEYGNGDMRKARLKKDGYTDAEIEQIQSKVNEILRK